MKKVQLAGIVAVALLAAALSTACWGGGSNSSAATNSLPSTSSSTQVVKPKPTIAGVVASTSGMFDDYVAILDVTVINNGSDGMAIVSGNVTQAGASISKEMPVYLAHSQTQTIKLVFPLKWRGGDWTPVVTAEVP